MASLFRSETMHLYQIIVSSDAAYDCVLELGEMGTLQFRDLNPGVNNFQRKFVHEVSRCNDMERKLQFLLAQTRKEDIPIIEIGPDAISYSPLARELNQLESQIGELDKNMRFANQNVVKLKVNLMELTEIHHLLISGESFFGEQNDSLSKQFLKNQTSGGKPGVGQLGFITGIVDRERLPNFERMIWRYSRGTALLRNKPIEGKLEDPVSGDKVSKSAFIVFFHGDHLRDPVRKICEGFRATMHACPETGSERTAMAHAVQLQLEDLELVMTQSQQLRRRMLTAAAKNLHEWSNKVLKTKAIYHHLNMFESDMTQKCMIGEVWCPVLDVAKTRMALERGTIKSGASMPSVFNRLHTKDLPPTFNRTNKFTNAFQVLINAYGMGRYRELNPAPYTIVTFPFLFSVMFGDLGHGLIVTIFAGWMVLFEKRIARQRSTNEIWNIFFGGRYVILLMGLFSIHSGFIYNDYFGKGVNLFGTTWMVNLTAVQITANKALSLDPKHDYTRSTYPAGLDPVWSLAHDNRILFLNSFKMKISVIFGVTHMIFGVVLSVFNYVHFRRRYEIWTTFLPRIVFLVFLFYYLVVIMFVKWFMFAATNAETRHSETCAPSLLITFINMMLFKKEAEPEGGVCSQFMYGGQEVFQKSLVLVAVLCIPVMLLAKPWWIAHLRNKRSAGNAVSKQDHEDEPEEEEEPMSELYIHQGIETIEYVLGSVSHTASYLRLWALSLAHNQLADVLWTMVLGNGIAMPGLVGSIGLFLIFAVWAVLTLSILVLMEGLSAFLHTLRLHWVEFQSKFYTGDGYAFMPFKLDQMGDAILSEEA